MTATDRTKMPTAPSSAAVDSTESASDRTNEITDRRLITPDRRLTTADGSKNTSDRARWGSARVELTAAHSEWWRTALKRSRNGKNYPRTYGYMDRTAAATRLTATKPLRPVS